MWDEITYPFPNFNGYTVEVWEWISNFISHLIGPVITYAWWDVNQSISIIWAPGLPVVLSQYLDLLTDWTSLFRHCGIGVITTHKSTWKLQKVHIYENTYNIYLRYCSSYVKSETPVKITTKVQHRSNSETTKDTRISPSWVRYTG